MNGKWPWLTAVLLVTAVAAVGCEEDGAGKSQPPPATVDTGGATDPGTGGTEDPGSGSTEDPGTGGTEDPGTGGTEDPGTDATEDPGAGGSEDTDPGPATDTKEACLLACGDGCFKPEHKVCGEDGEWWCPCEMACHEVAEAEDIFTCCEPVPSNCVPTCLDNLAMNCTSGNDEYGCIVLEWEEEECGEATCVADYEHALAYCKAESGPAKLCADTSGTWQDDACDCPEGTDWDDAEGCK